MNTFLTIVLGLTVAAGVQSHPTKLLSVQGQLDVEKQAIWDLTPIRIGEPVNVSVIGSGEGDVDCYLLVKNPTGQGQVIGSKDESNMDQCSITYTPSNNYLLRLLVINHGVHPTVYTATVEQ